MLLFLLGRVLFGGYFLMQAYYHFKNVDSYTGYAASKGVPHPKYAVLGTGVLLAIGGLSIVTASFIPWGVLALSIFLVGVTPKMHNYWAITDPNQQMVERVNFYKNLALLGGVLLLLAIESWPASLF
jgi:putative oxidoreductase